jgi:uncharacterized membrane protein YkoI
MRSITLVDRVHPLGEHKSHQRRIRKSKAAMIKSSITFIALSTSLCLSAWAAEGDKEEKVSLDKLPAAVAKALKAQAGDEKITGLSKEKDEGKTVYEATFTKKGHVHDVTVDEDGKLVSDEETIPVSEAPKVIREAIEREFPGGKIEKFERIKEGGKTNYEALLSGNKKREEIKFSEDGKVIEREDKTNDKDKD